MAYSWQEETYASGTTDISVDIEYLDQSYIYVYLDDVLTTAYSWSSDVLISLDTALTASTVVTLVRRTNKEDLYIKFADGAAFIRDNIDTQNTQFLHLAQELVEGRSIDGFYGDLSMNGFRITNLGTPTLNSDATTKLYVDKAVAAEAAARASADASLQSQITGDTPVLSAERSIISWHGQTIENSVIIPDNVNAFSIGPQIVIAEGQEVTVGDGSYWNVLGNVFSSDSLYNITANNITTEDGNTTVAVDEIVVDSDIGTIASQDASTVAITGGSVTGITDLAVADGGTGASTAEGARTNLGAAASGANTDITSITGSAATLTTARTIQTNLEATSAASFDGSDNVTPGVTGTLPISNGGTGATTAAAALTKLGAAPSAGVTDGSSAGTGAVGEILEGSASSAVTLSSGTAANAYSLALTAGEWEVLGVLQYINSGTLTSRSWGLSTTSATLPTTFVSLNNTTDPLSAGFCTVSTPSIVLKLTSAATVYLVAQAGFSSSTTTAQGYIRARRIR